MELSDVKNLIETYRKAGRTREETVNIVASLSINGESSEAFEYIDLVYQQLNRPQIWTYDRQLRDITDETLTALYCANDPAFIFQHSGQLARIAHDEKGRPFIEHLTENPFRGLLARVGDFIKPGRNGSISVTPPLDVVRDCLTVRGWQFPALSGIIEAPVIRPDGTILKTPGYDVTTGLYYEPPVGFTLPDIPDNPDDESLKAAIDLLIEPFIDFPFSSQADAANAVGTLILPVVRPMIGGPTPMTIFDKPQAGTGASLMAEAISLITSGRPAAMITAPKDDEGWRKLITSLLIKGQTVICVDNLEFALAAPSLAAVLTATTFQDRLLGRSETILLPNRATWIATGNNIWLRGDLPRRCLWVRLDAQTARPWLRDKNKFRHPDLIRWIASNRGELLAAILTVIRAWIVVGKPGPENLVTLGGFEEYSDIIGGILQFMGIGGYLDNLNAMYDQVDRETPEWEAFFEAWLNHFGDAAATAAEIKQAIESDSEFKKALPEVLAGRDGRDYSRRLGNALSKRANMRYPNGLMLKKAGEYNRAIKWQVMSYENANSYKFSLKNELSELILTRHVHAGARVYGSGAKNNSDNSYIDTKSYELAPKEDIYEYPTSACYTCGGDDWYWPGDYYVGPKQWLCGNCHPRPEEG